MKWFSVRRCLIALLLGGFGSLFLATVGLLLWEGAPFNTERGPFDDSVWFGYNASGISGLILLLSFGYLAIALLIESSIGFLRTATEKKSVRRAVLFHAVLGFLFVLVGIVAMAAWGYDIARCGVVFCVGRKKYDKFPSIRGQSFNALLAIMLFATLCPFGIIMLLRAHQLRWGAACGLELQEYRKERTTMRRLQSPGCRASALRLIPLVTCLMILACLSFYLPNDPRRFTSAFLAGYASLQTNDAAAISTYTLPEVSSPFFRTISVTICEEWVLKLYPSNIIFYSYLLFLVISIWLLRRTTVGRHWCCRRISWCSRLCYGEGIYLTATIAMSALFFLYWVHDHNFKSFWKGDDNDLSYITSAERWGRALGQQATLFLSLLMLPMVRTSFLCELIGVSRDSFLWIHRVLGYAMLAATIAHIVAFYVSYYQYGQLWHNLNYLPTIVGKGMVRNDFTVLVATWATWLLFVAMGGCAFYKIRRRFYELFYYSHLVASYAFFPAMLWHASAGWMYLMPGLILWIVDLLIRCFQRSARVTVLHTRIISDCIVEIGFALNTSRVTQYYPGHYVFVNIPEVSAVEWHPFTLANPVQRQRDATSDSVEVGDIFLVHMKSMGAGTWSDRVYHMVLSGQPFAIGIEGPCGGAIDFNKFDEVFLVGGGIGAVPCVSIYGSLMNLPLNCSLTRVTFIWCTRSAALVGAMTDLVHFPKSWHGLVHGVISHREEAPSCHACANDSLDHTRATFSCKVFVTQEKEYGAFQRCECVPSQQAAMRESTLPLPTNADDVANHAGASARVSVILGRPKLQDEICVSGGNDPARTLIFVCGPETLVQEAIRVGAALGVQVHQEEFLF